MRDRELYRRILGIEVPWYVERVERKLAEGEVHVHLEHKEVRSWPCPNRGADSKPYDHQAERGWSNLDTCQYQTILHARPTRAGYRLDSTLGHVGFRRWRRSQGQGETLCLLDRLLGLRRYSRAWPAQSRSGGASWRRA